MTATHRLTSFLAGCAFVAGASLAAGRASAAPLVDHHVHLVSPSSAVTVVPALLPKVAVPDDLADLLRRRTALAGDSTALAKLFVDPLMVLHALYPIWLKGEEALYTATSIPKGITVVPQYYRSDDKLAVIGGTWVIGEGAAARPVTNFMLHAEKAGGEWKIASEALTAKGPPLPKPVLADKLVTELDAGGVRQGVVLSLAYQLGSEDDKPEQGDEYAKVKAENDWTVAEAARFPGRLVALCGINPLKSYALREIERCASMPGVKGVKLHFGANGIDLRRPEHAERLRQLFAAANKSRLAVVVHLMSRRSDYGAPDTRIFLEKVLPAAPDVTVQVAHLAGSGPGLDAAEAIDAFATAAQARDPAMARLYFDVAGIVTADASPKSLERVAGVLRRLGLQRILFASDRAAHNDPPRAAWNAFRQLPLSDQEFASIAANVAPYLTDRR